MCFLEDLCQQWANHSREEVREMGVLVRQQKPNSDNGTGDVTVDLPKVMDKSTSMLKTALLSPQMPNLNWMPHPFTHPDLSSRVLVTFLLQPCCASACVILMYIPAGETVPQHAIAEKSVFQVLAGAKGAAIGPTKDMLKPVTDDQIWYIPPAGPKTFRAGPDAPLLLLGARSGSPECKFWFAHPEKHEKTRFNDVMSIDDIRKYYLEFTDSYEEVMRAWGYCMPEVTAEAIVKHAGIEDVSKTRVLDLGCGDGLTGQALTEKGFTNITAVDFSENMIALSEKRGCYKELKQTDLLQKLPFEDASFDLLVSTAVTTYIKPSVLTDWVRVCRPGGVVVFTHKTLIWAEWEAEQDRMEGAGLWEKVWVSEPVPYLPSLKEGGTKNCDEDAKVYIYKKKA